MQGNLTTTVHELTTASLNNPILGQTKAETYAVVGILSVFAITGTIGNAIAFYVFFKLKNKLTSTIFILALAGVDFITCLVTIPYTIAVEYLEFYVKYDAACKIYHFLITTTIPFSAFIMVAIAVDRYLCICHPFLHLMTIKRARIVVGCLSAFALGLGGIACVHYSVYRETYPNSHLNATLTPVVEATSRFEVNVTGYTHVLLQPTDASRRNYTISRGLAYNASTRSNTSDIVRPIEIGLIELYDGMCDTRNTTIDPMFFMVYQKLYSGFFLICCVVVFILYSLIYKSVISQRQKRLRIKSQKCCLMWDAQNVDNEQSEVTVALELNHSTTNGESLKTRPDDSLVPDNTNNAQANSSRARLERMRLANIKTAAMLFVVTLVFILAFSPAWLMVHKFITMNVVFFYMYFIYNVVNPIIYAFMNNAFRVELRKIFHCES